MTLPSHGKGRRFESCMRASLSSRLSARAHLFFLNNVFGELVAVPEMLGGVVAPALSKQEFHFESHERSVKFFRANPPLEVGKGVRKEPVDYLGVGSFKLDFQSHCLIPRLHGARKAVCIPFFESRERVGLAKGAFHHALHHFQRKAFSFLFFQNQKIYFMQSKKRRIVLHAPTICKILKKTRYSLNL